MRRHIFICECPYVVLQRKRHLLYVLILHSIIADTRLQVLITYAQGNNLKKLYFFICLWSNSYQMETGPSAMTHTFCIFYYLVFDNKRFDSSMHTRTKQYDADTSLSTYGILFEIGV